MKGECGGKDDRQDSHHERCAISPSIMLIAQTPLIRLVVDLLQTRDKSFTTLYGSAIPKCAWDSSVALPKCLGLEVFVHHTYTGL